MLPNNIVRDTQQNSPSYPPQPPATPGSLNYIPAAPEEPRLSGEIQTIAPENLAEPENTVEKASEKLPQVETIKAPHPKYLDEQENTPQQTPLVAKTKKPEPKIVDNTKDLTKFHRLTASTDPLTQLADKEEEEFISDVEAAHGHK